MEQNRQSIRNLLLDLANSSSRPQKTVFPVENHVAVAAHVVGSIDLGSVRLHGETYLVRFPLVCQSCKGLQFY
jgi:hypothetical protein